MDTTSRILFDSLLASLEEEAVIVEDHARRMKT
jgi:hypothetical protein